MEIFRTKTFTKAVKQLGATEEKVKAVEDEIAADHTTGDVIAGTSGARKIRFALGGKGKRGGGRAIYVAIVADDTAYMITAYSKATKDDLTNDDKRAIKEFVDSL
ncbi:MAG TPA: type II toxin-antitoxin system RelE/ParE family toxin [Rhizomicrobium sp.]|nr:type II toxin-antitoxin system RelE/ParE family toxin [Rhizomicrobium sp.]